MAPDSSNSPVSPPSRAPIRAIAGLLLNVIVLPGLGTLVSGDPKFRRTGWIQMGLSIIVVPFIAIAATLAWAPPGLDPAELRGILSKVMIVLGVWSALISVWILFRTWKADRDPAPKT
jgi:hypothetical protein